MKNITKLSFVIAFVFFVGIILGRVNFKGSQEVGPKEETKGTVASEGDIEAEEATPSPTPSPKIEKPNPSPTPGKMIAETSFLAYPNAVRIGQEGETILFESFDGADKITQWYKEKITEMGLGVKSFVQTTTNGNVLNSLAGADGQREVKVEISKKSSEGKVKISVRYH